MTSNPGPRMHSDPVFMQSLPLVSLSFQKVLLS